jgi:hypothetical protein
MSHYCDEACVGPACLASHCLQYKSHYHIFYEDFDMDNWEFEHVEQITYRWNVYIWR